MVDLVEPDPIAFDPALGIDQIDVIHNARAQDDADELRCAGAIALLADHQLFLLRRRPVNHADKARRGRGERQGSPCYPFHGDPPSLLQLNTKTATPESRPRCSATAGSALPARVPRI